jgi:hypothetical protein
VSLNRDDKGDVLEIAGIRWVGRFVISGHDRPQTWNVQNAKGQKGATSTHEGEGIAKFKLRLQVADDPSIPVDEYAELDKVLAMIDSTTSGPTPFALPIYTRDLARNRITAFSNGGIGGMVRDGKGGAYVDVDCIEYRPPQKKATGSAKAKGSSSTTKPAKVDPNAGAKAELAALVAQASLNDQVAAAEALARQFSP